MPLLPQPLLRMLLPPFSVIPLLLMLLPLLLPLMPLLPP